MEWKIMKIKRNVVKSFHHHSARDSLSLSLSKENVNFCACRVSYFSPEKWFSGR